MGARKPDISSRYKGPIPTCADIGPFCIAAPTPKQPSRLQVLTCTRPTGHPGNHCYADNGARVLAEWDATGKAVHPERKN